MTLLTSLLSLSLPFADAPNPADCPHHQCDYHPVTSGGIAVALIVVIVVAVLLLVLTVAFIHRHRRRSRGRG